MRRAIALATAVSLTGLLGWSPTSWAATDVVEVVTAAELLLEDHFSEQGFEVDLFVTRADDGSILSEATLFDPANADEVDVWTDGGTVWWAGTVDGQHIDGSADVIDVISPDAPQAFCLHPIGAIVCLGVLVAVFGGCGAGFGCPPGTDTNPPDSSGHGGGGDAEGDDGGDGEEGSDESDQ